MKTKKCTYCGGRFNIKREEDVCFSCEVMISMFQTVNISKDISMRLSSTSNLYWTEKIAGIINNK